MRNALSVPVVDKLMAALQRAEDDSDVRAFDSHRYRIGFLGGHGLQPGLEAFFEKRPAP